MKEIIEQLQLLDHVITSNDHDQDERKQALELYVQLSKNLATLYQQTKYKLGLWRSMQFNNQVEETGQAVDPIGEFLETALVEINSLIHKK